MVCQGISQDSMQIKGIVYNNDTYEPLPFATVAIKGATKGTVTNIEGRFRLIIDSLNLDDTLKISYVGFSPETLPIKDRKRQNIIYLKTKPVVLDEVVVSSERSKKILLKALQRTEANYPLQGMRMDGFYRAVVSDRNVPIQFSEAAFDIYKSAYNQIWRRDKIKLLTGRNKKDLPASPVWNHIKFINGPLELLYCDVARHPNSFIQVPQHRINFLKERHFKHYHYQLIKTISAKGNNLYVIDFSPVHRNAMFSGQIFIHRKTYAFAGLYYTIHPERINKAVLTPAQTRDYLIEKGITLRPTDYQCFINFRRIKDKWYFNYAHMQYSFMFIGAGIFSHLHTSTDLAITDIYPDKNERVKQGLMHWQQSLKEMIDARDNDFWEDYNHIELEEFRKKELNFVKPEAKNKPGSQ